MPRTTHADLLEDAFRRILSLEQRISSSDFVAVAGGTPSFVAINIGPAGSQYEINNDAIGVATGVTPTTGALYDNVYVDVAYIPPAGGDAVQYMVELARKISPGVYDNSQTVYTVGSYARFEHLLPATVYGTRVTGINRGGQYGTPSAWVDVTTGADSTIPLAPTGGVMTAGLSSIVMKWNENSSEDMKWGRGLYEVTIATDSGFTTDVRTIRTTATIVGFTDLIPGVQYWGRIHSIDQSGNQSGTPTLLGPVTTGLVGGTHMNVQSSGGNRFNNSVFKSDQNADGWPDYWQPSTSISSTQGVIRVADTDFQGGYAVQIAAATPADYYAYQDVSVPKGRYVIGCVVKRTAVTPGTGIGSGLNVSVTSGTLAWVRSWEKPNGVGVHAHDMLDSGTIAARWEWIVVDVTSTTATFRIYMQQGFAGTCTGTTRFGELQLYAGDVPARWSAMPEELLPQTVASENIVTVGLDAATIKFGSMDGDRITANTAVFNILEANTSLTTKDLFIGSGGQIIVGTSTNGLVLNSQGLRLMLGGVAQVTLDATTGGASFKGSVTSGSTVSGATVTGGTIIGTVYKTQATGTRWEFASSFGSAELSFYSGDSNETNRGFIQGGSSGYINILGSTISTTSPNPGFISIFSTGINMGRNGLGAYVQLYANADGGNLFTQNTVFGGTVTSSINQMNWQYPSLNSNWVWYGYPWANIRYAKDMFGVVHMEGLVYRSGGTGTGEVIFTIGVGFRPVYHNMFSVEAMSSGGARNQARVDVYTDGTVNLSMGDAGGYLQLSGISFCIY